MTTPPTDERARAAAEDAPRRAAVALTKARLSAKENAGWLTALLRECMADAVSQAVKERDAYWAEVCQRELMTSREQAEEISTLRYSVEEGVIVANERAEQIARLRGYAESTALWLEQEPARVQAAVAAERERCSDWIRAEGDRLRNMLPDERPFAVQALWNAAEALRAPTPAPTKE